MAIWRVREESSCVTAQWVLIGLVVVAGVMVLVGVLLMTAKYAPWRHQQPLLLKLQTFTVTNLNTSISDSLAGASFRASLLFANPNPHLDISIPNFTSFLFFNHTGETGKRRRDNLVRPISCSLVGPLHLGPLRQRLVHVFYDASQCGGEQPLVEADVLEAIRRDGIEGFLGIEVGLELRVNYRTGILFWEYEVKPKCPSVSVKFVATSGVGWLDSGSPLFCSVEFS